MEGSYSSHSHSKTFSSRKACHNNVNGFTAYDDVFGGPPKFGVTGFAPRTEDYTEVFGSFRSSRASSIPILDLPAVDDAVVSFDVRSSNFDYAEVFSGFHAVDFATPFDELFKHSDGHVGGSSEEAWTAAGTESPSEESDPSTCLGNEAIQQSFDSKQLNVSYHRVDLGARDGKSDVIHVTQLNALPGYCYVVDEAASFQKIEKDNFYSQATDDIIFTEDSSGNISEEQYARKIFPNPSHGGTSIQSFVRDHRPGRAHETGGAPPNPTFISISDICLRTQPSHLPPPSRPPPILAERKDDPNKMTSDSRAPRSCISEITVDESLPHFFDVDMDASSSAVASAAAMKEAMEKAQAKLRTMKEMMVRKKDGPQRSTRPGLENRVDGQEKTRMIIDDECHVKDSRQEAKQEGEHKDGKCSGKGSQGAQKDESALPDPFEQSANVAGKPSQRKHMEHSFSADPVLTEGAGEWKEAMQYYELISNDNSSSANQLPNYEDYLLQGTNAYHPGNNNDKEVAFELWEDGDERIKAARKTHEQQKNAVSTNSVKGAYEQEENRWRLKATKASSRQEYHEKMVEVAQTVHDSVVYQHVENEKSLNGASEENCNEKRIVIENQLEKNDRRVDPPQRADSDKNGKHSPCQEDKDIRLREALEMEGIKQKVNEACKGEDNERRLKEVPERDENEKRVKKAFEGEEIERNLRIAVKEDKKISEKMFVLEENEKQCKEATKEGGKRIKEVCSREGFVVKEAWDRAQSERSTEEAVDLHESDKIFIEAAEVEECKKHEDLGEEKNRKSSDENHGPLANEKKLEELQRRDEDETKFERNLEQAELSKKSTLPSELEEPGKEHAYVLEKEEQYSVCKDDLPILLEAIDEDSASFSEIHLSLPADVLKSSNEACSLNEKFVKLADMACKLEKPQKNAYAAQEEAGDVGIGKIRTECGEEELIALKMEDVVVDKRRTESVSVQDSAKNRRQDDEMVEASVSVHVDEKTTNSDRVCIGEGQAPEEEKGQVCNPCFVKEFNHERGGRMKTVREAEVLLEQVKNNDRSATAQALNGFTEHVRRTEPNQSVMFGKKEGIQKRSQVPNINETIERKAKVINETSISQETEKEEMLKGERELESERLRQLEEEREREREREKDRIAVDVATREARERAERATVERTTAEARQRAMAEARERLERVCAEAREKSEKASTEARLRAERAAVERATAEARERAIEKAMADRAKFEARETNRKINF
ncbi:hypothetical protein Ancab_026511 [Ancistrocladus abbreviatus]